MGFGSHNTGASLHERWGGSSPRDETPGDETPGDKTPGDKTPNPVKENQSI